MAQGKTEEIVQVKFRDAVQVGRLPESHVDTRGKHKNVLITSAGNGLRIDVEGAKSGIIVPWTNVVSYEVA